MFKCVLRLFGSGKLPTTGQRVIEAEHRRLLKERMLGCITYRNFRTPEKGPHRRRRWFLGSLAVSDRRLLIYRYGSCLLQVTFDDKRCASLDVSAEKAGHFSIVYDASLFQPLWSGEIEISFKTPDAIHICDTIASSTCKRRVKFGGRAPSR